MKIINSLIVAVSVLGAGSALAGEYPAQDYLVEHHLVDASFEGGNVVDRQAAAHSDPAVRYLSDSGLIEAPTRPADIRFQGPAFAIDAPAHQLLVDWGLLAS
ncbi:hypothetical protein H0Z60_17240 [Ectothiorhodospiraceae bacterium WFHF3C12]|nr:hypothetical protein [Ectothiorhodospiraceae bacterium WFHF3C12]